jgi:hypothetical protein
VISYFSGGFVKQDLELHTVTFSSLTVTVISWVIVVSEGFEPPVAIMVVVGEFIVYMAAEECRQTLANRKDERRIW